MKGFKKFLVTFITLAITFVIPITLTQVIRQNPEDVRTRAQEITAEAAQTVNTGFTALSKSPTLQLPIIGEIAIATLGLFAIAFIFLILTIITGINLFKSKGK